jgi:predicted metal-dependent hydrolase
MIVKIFPKIIQITISFNYLRGEALSYITIVLHEITKLQINLEIRVGITNQKNKWASLDHRECRIWSQVTRRSEHLL